MLAEQNIQPVSDPTVRRQVFDRLKEHIVNGRYPPGQRLTERSLAESLRVSRGPLREAIRELTEIGLIESLPYKGIFVRSVTRKDLEELYTLRTVVERFAFKMCWGRRNPTALSDLVARGDALKKTIEEEGDELLAIDQELHLHNWCYELSGHSLLQKTWRGLEPHLKFYFSVHQRAHRRKGPLRQSHALYVELATGGDLEAMLDHIELHMQQGLKRTIADLPED